MAACPFSAIQLPMLPTGVDPETGKTFLTQWFERRRFELHPENQPPYDVLGGLIGKDLRRDALVNDPDFRPTSAMLDPSLSPDVQWYFPQTGHNLRLDFLVYWHAHGGIMQFGLPISEEYREIDPETGNDYVVQWFERARFERHPENQSPYTILLGLLGKEIITPGQNPRSVWKTGLAYNALHRVYGVATDSHNYVYITDGTLHRVQKYDPTGHLVNQWGEEGGAIGQFVDPGSIAIDGHDNVYVADVINRRIQKFTSGGAFLTQWGGGGNDAKFSNGFSLATDRHGHVYVADYQTASILVYDEAGQYRAMWKAGNSNRQLAPSGISTDAQGNVYAAVFVESGGQSVVKFDPSGTVIANWTRTSSGGATIDSITDLAATASGELYLLHGDMIEHLDNTGHFVGRFGSRGTQLPRSIELC